MDSDTAKKIERLSRLGITRSDDGRLHVCYVDDAGQKQTLDLTDEIERIATDKVKDHQRDFHGA